MQPEIWNPVTGEIKNAENWKIENNRTCVSLTLVENESLFVVFRKVTTDKCNKNSVKSEKIPIEIRDWKVTFAENPSIDKSVTGLFDWSRSVENEIKYYSGSAVYEANLNWDTEVNPTSKIYLDLGKVEVMAKVYVNDIYCGTAWTHPYRVDISKAITNEANLLKIDVVNTWANKIKGVHEGQIKDESIWTNAPYRLENQPLQPSGLLGPLHLLISDK